MGTQKMTNARRKALLILLISILLAFIGALLADAVCQVIASLR